MKPHPKLRKTIKWAGAAVTMLLVVAWIGSGWWILGIIKPKPSRLSLGIVGGVVVVMSDDVNPIAQWGFYCHRQSNIIYWPWRGVGGLDSSFATQWALTIPLWIPSIATFVATCTAWRLDALARRRARLNFCPKCTYDRTGLAPTAVCPECGATPNR